MIESRREQHAYGVSLDFHIHTPSIHEEEPTSVEISLQTDKTVILHSHFFHSRPSLFHCFAKRSKRMRAEEERREKRRGEAK